MFALSLFAYSRCEYNTHAQYQIIPTFRMLRHISIYVQAVSLIRVNDPYLIAFADENYSIVQLSTDPAFCLRIRALVDLYDVLGRASKAVQSTQALPWERQAAQEEVLKTITDMRVALIASYKKSPSTAELLLVTKKAELWPCLSEAQSSLSAAEVSAFPFENICTVYTIPFI